jgi:hypothetical protein
LFGLLVGFGGALLKKTLIDGPQKFDIFDKDNLWKNCLDILVIFCSLFNLVLTFAFGIYHKYELTRSLGYSILFLYLVFIIAATTISLIQIL